MTSPPHSKELCVRQFLESELAREKVTLREVRQEVGHEYHEAVWMLKLTITQLNSELRWLNQVKRQLLHRAPARRPRSVHEKSH